MLSGFRPPLRLTGSEWADEYGRIPSSGAEPGRWRCLAWQRGILDALTDPTIPVVVMPKSARVGGTKLLLKAIGYHIHHDPCPISVYMPNDAMAKNWAREELEPEIRETPALEGLFSDPKSRDASNAKLYKEFPGGVITAFGAESANNFRQYTRRVVIGDDLSGWPMLTVEGDQVKLMMQRTVNYWNRKIALCSSPSEEGMCRITEWWLKSDQRRFYVPCPSCGAMQYLRFGQFKWEKDDPETVTYECESCAERIPPEEKMKMVEHERAEWRSTAPQSTRMKIAGFHVWAAYGNAPNTQWPDIVDEFLQSKSDREQLRVFVNTVLGEPYRLDYHTRVSAEGLLARREEALEEGVIPGDAVIVTFGVDTQDNRLEASLWGWGPGEEAFLLMHEVIVGDPSIPEGQKGSPWDQVTALRRQRWPEGHGAGLVAPFAAVDSGGHHSGAVYQYAKDYAREGVIAIKGGNRPEQPMLGKGSAVDYSFNGRLLKGGKVFTINSDAIKTLLFGRMKNSEAGAPGSFHFPGWMEEDLAKQLTVEQRKPVRRSNGQTEMRWVCPPNKRNEATDCLVYAYAALLQALRRYDRRTAWDQLARAKVRRMAQADQQQPVPAPRVARKRRMVNPF